MAGGSVIPTLAGVVRGLLILFWAVPGVLLADIAMALDFAWRQFGFAPTVVAAGSLVVATTAIFVTSLGTPDV